MPPERRRHRKAWANRLEQRIGELAAGDTYRTEDLINTMRLVASVVLRLDLLESKTVAVYKKRRRRERVSVMHLFATANSFDDSSTSENLVAQEIIQDIAEIGRQIMGDRVREGMARARAAGSRGPGRPATDVTIDAVRRLYAEGMSFRAIAKMLNASRSTVHRRFMEGAKHNANAETELADVRCA